MKNRERAALAIALGSILLMLLVQAIVYRPSEPYFNNDETRHVMTGVFFRDFLTDFPITHVQDYIIRYYLQYPALGFPLWPPLFHFIEGLFMIVFGTSILVSKALILASAALACFYFFLLARRTHGSEVAALAVPLLAFAPIMFVLSHHVMLEMPTLALGLGATYHFVRFLDFERRSDLFASALLAALAALTRFSAVYLVPVFLILIVSRRKWSILRRPDTYLAAALGLVLVVPFYALTARAVGWVYWKLLTGSDVGHSGPPLSLQGLLFYPSQIPHQIGWFAFVPCILGLARAFAPSQRFRASPYLAIVAVTFLMFTPMGIRDSRYAIYWVPALVLFAADGVQLLSSSLRNAAAYPALGALVFLGTAASSLAEPVWFLRGYESAARYVIDNTRASKCCLFDGGLNGNFIYQMRRHDPERKLWVLRGDKILYSVLLYGKVGHAATPKEDGEMLATIFKFDPELIVVEEPLTFEHLEPAERFRAILDRHPERFRLETTIPIETSDKEFEHVRLKIYRSLVRNPKPPEYLDVAMLALRRTLRTSIAPGAPPR